MSFTKPLLNPIQRSAVEILRRKQFRDPILFTGENSILKLPAQLEADHREHILLAVSSTLLSSGLLGDFFGLLDERRIGVTVYSGIPSDPTIEAVDNGLARYWYDRCDCIVAIGGGSVLDCGKMIALRAGNPQKSVLDMSYPLARLRPGIPVYAVPTTAGSGSEVTPFAVVTDPDKHQKIPIISDGFLPCTVVLDPLLSRELPYSVAANAGMDALTHAIEGYLSVFSRFSPEDRSKAPFACKEIFSHLRSSCASPFSPSERLSMSVAAFEAGRVFRKTGCGYVHALAHRLGERYGISHGKANAVLLPVVLRASRPAVDLDLAELSVYCGFGIPGEPVTALADRFIAEIDRMRQDLGISSVIHSLRTSDFSIMIERAQREMFLQGPPVHLAKHKLRRILKQILPPSAAEPDFFA